MNPYTRSLLERIDAPDLRSWVESWDQLESLVIEVYRMEAAGPDDEREFRHLRSELRAEYGRWKPGLETHWQGLEAGGEVLDSDPFWALLEPEGVGAFVGNWKAMQTLPAAREALNNYLIEHIESGGEGPDESENGSALLESS